jgi:hypothetical protein
LGRGREGDGANGGMQFRDPQPLIFVMELVPFMMAGWPCGHG